MVEYIGFLYVIISSIYSISYSRYAWREKNYLASIGTLFLVFLSMIISIIVYLRT